MERFKIPLVRGNLTIPGDRSRVAAEVPHLYGKLYIQETALAGGIAALGAPGTGKTVLTTRIIKSALERYPDMTLLIFAPKADAAEYLGLGEGVEYWPEAPRGGQLFKYNIFLDAYLAEYLHITSADMVFSEFFNTFVMQEAEQAAWLTMAARLATLVAYIIYRTEVKILRGVGRSVADYLPNMMRLVEALSDIEVVKDIVKRGLAELDKSTVPPSLRGAVGAAENFVKMPPFGDVYNSYVTAMSMIVSRLNTPNVDKSYDGAFLRLSRHAVREAKHLRPLKAVYIWQSDLGTAVRDVATALIQSAIALNFKLRAQLKANGVEEPPMIVFLDDFITLGYIEVMAKLPNVGRSVGMWSVVTAQTTKHLTEYGPKKENVLAAYNTVFAFSVTDADSAEYIARRVGVLEPKWRLFDKTPKSEVISRAGRVDASILDVPPGTAVLLSSRPVYKSRNVAIVRLYDPRPKPWDKLKELFRRGGT